jgi:hypothetical protein
MSYSHQYLKAKQRRVRDKFHTNVGTRIHRALSWLKRAELCVDGDDVDRDSQFIFLWIAFNAAYGQDHEKFYNSETELFSRFIAKLVELDHDKALYELVWEQFSSHIRILLDNQYVFQPFWEFQKGKIEESKWQRQFQQEKGLINAALATENTDKVLSIILRRMYTLRNQLMHGGATWQGSVNRAQLTDSVAIMALLVPIVINLMLDNPLKFMGEPSYPLIGEYQPDYAP